MSERNEDLTRAVGDLVRTLQDLESELDSGGRRGPPRPPTPRELVRFTSEVAIPATILVLRTNIEALQLLQRTLRMAEGRDTDPSSSAEAVQERVERVGTATLNQLDDALADLQTALEGRPEHEDARDLLAEARELREDVETRLSERTDGADGDVGVPSESTAVDVDVESELQSIKDDVDCKDGDEGGDEPHDGNGTGDGGNRE